MSCKVTIVLHDGCTFVFKSVQDTAVELCAERQIWIEPLTKRELRSKVPTATQISFTILVAHQDTCTTGNRDKPVILCFVLFEIRLVTFFSTESNLRLKFLSRCRYEATCQ